MEPVCNGKEFGPFAFRYTQVSLHCVVVIEKLSCAEYVACIR